MIRILYTFSWDNKSFMQFPYVVNSVLHSRILFPINKSPHGNPAVQYAITVFPKQSF